MADIADLHPLFGPTYPSLDAGTAAEVPESWPRTVDSAETAFRVDPRRRGMIGYSFGGIVTTLVVSGRTDYAGAVIQAPGALNWNRSSELRDALTSAAAKIAIPIQCVVAENDATTESARAVCGAAKTAPAELKVYPPFTPTRQPLQAAAPGHALFSPQGLAVWKADVLAFLDKYVRGARL